ncbi:hypothetical protein RclHR1_08330004 [Rhizophagus clarus]|uniref:Uncharacterized protein n=1 Tax=Rhizophagus clarus TaxID=94130 RepID=A0A2Z6S2G4_9GLOM|nr:hypothetical protein RclHR1_08330004 [Rhizophagus clarus]GES72741.1 hypothetical protein RCL_e26451_RclHR1_08330004 [Rhizophagus clarus]
MGIFYSFTSSSHFLFYVIYQVVPQAIPDFIAQFIRSKKIITSIMTDFIQSIFQHIMLPSWHLRNNTFHDALKAQHINIKQQHRRKKRHTGQTTLQSINNNTIDFHHLRLSPTIDHFQGQSRLSFHRTPNCHRIKLPLNHYANVKGDDYLLYSSSNYLHAGFSLHYFNNVDFSFFYNSVDFLIFSRFYFG